MRKKRIIERLIVTLVIVAVIVAVAAVFVPRLAHTCDNCANFFIGTGYYANVISNTISSISGENEKILCKECAAKEHALAIATGKSLTDFQRPLFEERSE